MLNSVILVFANKQDMVCCVRAFLIFSLIFYFIFTLLVKNVKAHEGHHSFWFKRDTEYLISQPIMLLNKCQSQERILTNSFLGNESHFTLLESRTGSAN